MNLESLFSFLIQSPWVFLTGLVLILCVAFADTFSQKPGPSRPSRTEHTPPR
jgi:hypothetical protein